MGSSSSTDRDRDRDRQHHQHHRPPPPPVPQAGPTYATYPPPPVFAAPGQYYQPPPQAPNATNGQYYAAYGGYPQQPQPQPQPQQPQYPMQYRPPAVPAPYQPPAYAPQQYGQPPRAPVQTQEYQTTATIRNQVNLKKQTLKLEPSSQPGVFSIAFKFDASAPCRVTTFVCALEDTKRACRITSPFPVAPAVSFEKGLEHKFPNGPSVASSHVVNTVRANARDLTSVQGDTFPVIIRLEALTDEGVAQARSLDALEAGCELPPWVQSQTTYARLAKEDDGSWGLRVTKQKIWVKGTSYELQEIYGMEQNKAGASGAAGGGDGYEDVDGNECVICMSAPRDTTALPCRHMCMCHGCASALKTQTNKCPICRCEVESLLHIVVKAPAQRAA